jgi:cytochrome c553
VLGELTLVNHFAHRVQKPVKSHPSKARECLTLCCRDRAWSACWRCHERSRERAKPSAPRCACPGVRGLSAWIGCSGAEVCGSGAR